MIPSKLAGSASDEFRERVSDRGQDPMWRLSDAHVRPAASATPG